MTSNSRILADLEETGVYAKDMAGFIAGSEIVHEAKIAYAEMVRDYWRGIAPHWGDHDPKDARPPTGLGRGGSGVPNEPDDYEPSIEVWEYGDRRVSVGSELIPLAVFLEYGTEHTPEFACGARTLAHFGGGPVEGHARITDELFIG